MVLDGQIDWAKLKLDYLRSDVDSRVKLAAARADLAEKAVDIARKRVQLAAEIEEQRRMKLAHEDFLSARNEALRELRKLKRTQYLEEKRLRSLKGLLVDDTPASVRNGWIAFKYFLRRVGVDVLADIVTRSLGENTVLEALDHLRRYNLSPSSNMEILTPLMEIIQRMAESLRERAEGVRLELLETQKRADDIRTADWKTVKLDTSWMTGNK